VPKELLVGIETADDAAVYKLNDEQALIATTDFFMPIVDDPFDFGRIAATNAISDVYAMGGTPIMALALVGMPINKLPLETIGQIIKGGESICAEAGIPIAGGHTIDSVEPIYGLVVLGLVHPSKIKRNADARAGDVLILGKPLGVGVLSAALKKDALDAAGYAAMIANTTKLNKPGKALAETRRRARADRRHRLRPAGPPAGTGARRRPDGAARRWRDSRCCRASSSWPATATSPAPRAQLGCLRQGRRAGAGVTPAQQALLTDPQTSGGLLVSCDPPAASTRCWPCSRAKASARRP
jgi:selenide,water dikinase